MKNKSRSINRRNFVKAGMAAGAGLILAPLFMKHARANDSNDLNIALLGAGAQGQVLLNACLKIPNLRFRAVCDIWTEYSLKRAHNLLQKYGHELNAYQDFQEDRKSVV